MASPTLSFGNISQLLFAIPTSSLGRRPPLYLPLRGLAHMLHVLGPVGHISFHILPRQLASTQTRCFLSKLSKTLSVVGRCDAPSSGGISHSIGRKTLTPTWHVVDKPAFIVFLGTFPSPQAGNSKQDAVTPHPPTPSCLHAGSRPVRTTSTFATPRTPLAPSRKARTCAGNGCR